MRDWIKVVILNLIVLSLMLFIIFIVITGLVTIAKYLINGMS